MVINTAKHLYNEHVYYETFHATKWNGYPELFPQGSMYYRGHWNKFPFNEYSCLTNKVDSPASK